VTTCFQWLDEIRKEHGEIVKEKEALSLDLIHINEIHSAQELK
jgi:hypothetical protein